MLYERDLQKAVKDVWAARDALSKVGYTQRKEAGLDEIIQDLRRIGYTLHNLIEEKFPA